MNLGIKIILEAVEIIRENPDCTETRRNQLYLIERETKILRKSVDMFGR